MNIPKNAIIAVVFIAALLLIIALVLFFIQDGKENDSTMESVRSKQDIIEDDDITGSQDKDHKDDAAEYINHQMMQEVHAEQEATSEEIRSFYDAALLQILTTGEWLSIDETTTLNFTDRILFIEHADSEVREYSYVITALNVINGNYSIKMDLHDEISGLDFNNSDVGITVGEDDRYTIICGNFAYAQKYQKTVEIIFTQGSIRATDQETGQGSPGYREIIRGDGTVDRITQLSRDDYPDDSEHRAKIAALVEQEIYGTWMGTFEEMVNANTVYWTFTFDVNGTYSFTNGDSNEIGSFTLTHNNDKYHSTLHLVPDAGEAKERRIFLSGDTIIAMTIEGDIHPTYFKQ